MGDQWKRSLGFLAKMVVTTAGVAVTGSAKSIACDRAKQRSVLDTSFPGGRRNMDTGRSHLRRCGWRLRQACAWQRGLSRVAVMTEKTLQQCRRARARAEQLCRHRARDKRLCRRALSLRAAPRAKAARATGWLRAVTRAGCASCWLWVVRVAIRSDLECAQGEREWVDLPST